MSELTEPLVIDVDTGIDDAFALLYACAHDETQILGVSTVVGNVSLAAATRNTRAVLALAGRAGCPCLAGRGDGDLQRGQGCERDSRPDRPWPCGLA